MIWLQVDKRGEMEVATVELQSKINHLWEWRWTRSGRWNGHKYLFHGVTWSEIGVGVTW